jgi:intracellular multiplication protein IcmK
MKIAMRHLHSAARPYFATVVLGLALLHAGTALAQTDPFFPGDAAPTPAVEQPAKPILPTADPNAEPAADTLAEPTLPGSAEPSAEPNLPGFMPAPPAAPAAFEDEEFNFDESPDDMKNEARQEAFDAALQGLLPLKPEEIRKLLEHFDRTQESVELPVYPAPKPEVAVETLSLDPGTKPTTIKTAYGYVTTVAFVDTTGQPWPIQNITWAGNFDIVEVQTGQNEATHTLRITPQSEFAYGNMSIQMLTLNTPIIISLETSRDMVHYRFDAIVPQEGPFATTPIIENGVTLAAGDADMSGVLEGVVPPSAIKMSVTGVDSRTSAYRFNGMTYLRTPLALLSPAWMSSASSADGMHVYALNHAPVVLLSDKGKMVRAYLSDREDISEDIADE